MTTPFVFGEDFRKRIFGDEPEFAFQTSITQAGLPRSMSQFFRRQTKDFLGRFQGALGQELQEFGTATLNPLDFFKGLDFRQEFGQFSPRERGESPSLFNPRTRFLFF